MRWPRAKTPLINYAMGMDLDLDVAMRHATRETVEFLGNFGLSVATPIRWPASPLISGWPKPSMPCRWSTE